MMYANITLATIMQKDVFDHNFCACAKSGITQEIDYQIFQVWTYFGHLRI